MNAQEGRAAMIVYSAVHAGVGLRAYE